MTKKLTDGWIERNANVRAYRQVPIFDDQGRSPGLVPNAVKAYIVEDNFDGGLLRRVKLTCTALPISVADDAGVAQYGGVQVYTMPEGIICLHGAVVNGTVTMGATGTFINTWAGVFALGSATAGTGTTLLTTEATWLQSVAISAATTKVGTLQGYPVATQVTEAGARWYAGQATPGPVFLNLAIADDATHTAGTGTFTGVIEMVYMVLGDY
jgi:hypothetical protein